MNSRPSFIDIEIIIDLNNTPPPGYGYRTHAILGTCIWKQTKQNKNKQTKQNKTKQNKTKQNKTKQNKTKQNKTKQNKTKQNKGKAREDAHARY
jgi:hypothetical protein